MPESHLIIMLDPQSGRLALESLKNDASDSIIGVVMTQNASDLDPESIIRVVMTPGPGVTVTVTVTVTCRAAGRAPDQGTPQVCTPTPWDLARAPA